MSLMANAILDCVESWASNYWMIRETGIIPCHGRIDALLVPLNAQAQCMEQSTELPETGLGFFSRLRLMGVEVKTNWRDFQRGLREGQFNRYYDALGGLYIATPPDKSYVWNGPPFKDVEFPPYAGHLVVTINHADPMEFTGGKCVCRKRPMYKQEPIPHETAIRLVWELARLRIDDKAKAEADLYKLQDKIKDRVGREILRPIMAVMREVCN